MTLCVQRLPETGTPVSKHVGEIIVIKSVFWCAKRYSSPITGLDSPRGFQEFEATRFQDSRLIKVLRLSALRTGCLYPPGNIPGTHFCYSGTAVAQWLRCCATNRKVAGSIPAGVSGII